MDEVLALAVSSLLELSKRLTQLRHRHRLDQALGLGALGAGQRRNHAGVRSAIGLDF